MTPRRVAAQIQALPPRRCCDITPAGRVVPKAELLYRPDRRLTDQDGSGVQAQGSNSPRRRLGQLLTSLVSTSVR